MNFKISPTFRENFKSEVTVFIALLILGISLSIASPYFLSFRNFMNIGLFSSIMGITATSMTMCLLAGGIDLSVGSVMALSGVVVAVTATKTDNIVLILGSGLVVGMLCGLFNALVITKGRINSFITTLSSMLIFRGFAYLYTDGGSVIASNPGLKWLGRGYFMSIPVPLLIMIACFIIFGFILSKTEFGRNVYAVGGNVAASFLAGINVAKTQFFIYIISGTMAGLSGILITAQSGAGLPQAADGLQMDIIASVILGGASLFGGKGNVIGTLLGIFILSTLNNGMTLLNIPSFWQLVAKGGILLLAVALDVMRNGGYKKSAY
jgi:ribose transport system permease protein